MLLSPGHSPRHISSPSPTPSQPQPHSLPSTQTPKVLDEDTYVAAIERIIERDYFPDIPKLRDRLDWLQAVNSRDPVLIRDAQLKIQDRRRLRHNGNHNHNHQILSHSTPNTNNTNKFKSPSLTPSLTPFTNTSEFNFNNNRKNNDSDGKVHGEERESGEEDIVGDVSVKEMGLDQFLWRYTSEDNESFGRIMEKVNNKRKERYAHLLIGEGEEKEGVLGIEGSGEEEGKKKREKVSTDGYGTSDQPVSTIEGWKYTARNALMYIQNGEAPLTEEERVKRATDAAERVISKGNTRFHGKGAVEEEVRVVEEGVGLGLGGMTPMVVSDREREKRMRYDLEDLRRTPAAKGAFYVETEKKAENGYSFVKTPSPAPGVDGSPFITWGEIEGTPLRLDDEDTPIDIGGSGAGPQFKMPCPPVRDVKAHSLSREAARKIKERTKMYERPPLPSPMRGGSASPSVRTFSPAAQKFMRSAMKKSSSKVDESLRASYRGNSPSLATPKSGRSLSRLVGDGSPVLRSPSVGEGSNPPW